MKNRITVGQLLILGCAVLLATNVSAQQPKPSPTPEKSSANTASFSEALPEQKLGDYSIVSSIELGARGLRVVGDDDKYRSDLNYHAGVRIFDSSFFLRQKDHSGTLFDEFLVNSSGWGGDPQGHTRISAEKKGIYRFDANVRRLKYFNNLANLALGQHTQNTRMRFGDYDLTLLPEHEKLRFYLGYSRSTWTGPGFTTFHVRGDEFVTTLNQRAEANNYRVGVDAKLLGFDISFLQGFRYSRDDTTFVVPTPSLGNIPTDFTRIDSLTRDLPTRGRHYFTRFSAHRLFAKKLDFTGRFIYLNSTSRFSLIERMTGRRSDGKIIKLEQATTSGKVKRPFGIGDIGVTFLATNKLRISDTFRVENFRINGGDVLTDFLISTTAAGSPLPDTTTNTLFLRTTNFRRFMNTVEADYQFTPRFAVHGGYRFRDRRIELFSLNNVLGATPAPETEEFNNRTHSAIFGLKARPVKIWTLYFDGEHGTSDSVFTRLGNNDFTNFRVRNRIAPNSKVVFNFSLVTKNNSNPSEVLQDSTLLPAGTAPNALDVDIRSRTFTSSVDWTPNAKFNLSGGYTYQHLTSDAGIILFLANRSRVGESRNFIRDHFVFVNAFVHPVNRVTLYASYRINKDIGQGNRIPTDPTIIIGSYPASFQSPEARLSLRVNRRIDWNLGYQYYNYRESPLVTVQPQNYHAHLPYTSLRIYIGRAE